MVRVAVYAAARRLGFPKLIVIGLIAAFALYAIGGARAAETLIVKQTDESVNTSTAFQDDDELAFASGAGTLYQVSGVVRYVSPAGDGAPDIKVQLIEDTTARGALQWQGFTTTNAVQSQTIPSASGSSSQFGTDAGLRAIRYEGWLIGNGGTVKLRWAQNTSDAADVTVKAGSTLRYGPFDDPPPGAGGAEELSDLSDVDTTGAIDGAVLKYDEAAVEWQVATDEVGSGSSGPVTLSAGDRERLDLAWWGVWALVGLALLALIAPAMYRLLDVRQGMGGRFERG